MRARTAPEGIKKSTRQEGNPTPTSRHYRFKKALTACLDGVRILGYKNAYEVWLEIAGRTARACHKESPR